MGMTMKQIDHAERRLQEALREKLGPQPLEDRDERRQAEVDFLKKQGPSFITKAMWNRALKATQTNINRKSGWPRSFEEYLGQTLDKELEKKIKGNHGAEIKAWQDKQARLHKEFDTAMDQIILGDAEAALKVIAEFRNLKI